VELALYGVNSLCQAMVHAIDPHLQILTPLEARSNFIFSVKETVS
jgi:hypothetical protein